LRERQYFPVGLSHVRADQRDPAVFDERSVARRQCPRA